MTKTWQNVALLTGIALTFGTVYAETAEAAVLNYDFSVNVNSGSLSGQTFLGSFTVDDSKLTGVGTERLNPSNNGLSVSLNFNGTSLTSASDTGYPNFPFVEFDNGSLVGLNWLPSIGSTPVAGIADSVISEGGVFTGTGGGNQFAYDLSAVGGSGTGEGTVTYTALPVPAPSSTVGLMTLGVLGVWRKVRKSQDIELTGLTGRSKAE